MLPRPSISLIIALFALTGCLAGGSAGLAPGPSSGLVPTDVGLTAVRTAPEEPTPAPATPTPIPPTPTPEPTVESDAARATGEIAAPGAPPPSLASGVVGVYREPRGERPGRLRTIALDPGHGGPEIGATSGSLAEKNVNLGIALELTELLQDDGFRVVLTRASDQSVSPEYTSSGVRGQLTLDLQARVDIANQAIADLFVSIHNNGAGDTGQRGTEVWYNAARPFSDRNLRLAQLALDHMIGQLRRAGHPTLNRGIKDDANFRVFQGRSVNIFVLGPGTPTRPRNPTQMPAILGESLFLSNPVDAAALRRPEIWAAIARGYQAAILDYFAEFPE